MELFKSERSKFWRVDFTVDGKRFRRTTRAITKTRAMEEAAEIIRKAQAEGDRPKRGPAPILSDFATEKFLPYVDGSQLDPDTKRYYHNGWRLLQETQIAGWRIGRIKRPDVETLSFPGGGSNANTAIRTLRRMLSLAHEWNLVDSVPRLKSRKENQRSATYSAAWEKAFLDAAPQPLHDVFLISQDSGLRPDEVIRMRWENVLWDKNLIFNPGGKTKKSRRYVPLSDRVRAALESRQKGSTSEWIFPSSRKKGAHISYFPVARDLQRVREKIGMPKDLVLYSARHTFCTDLLDRTGNLALVQHMAGHESLLTTQRYLHPSFKEVASVINERNTDNNAAVK